MSKRYNTSYLKTGKMLNQQACSVPLTFGRYRAATAYCCCQLLLSLPLILLSLFTNAQFIRLNIDIPPKTGLSEYEPFEMALLAVDNSGLQILEGSTMFTISAAENLHVLVQARVSETLMNVNQQSLPLAVKLDYRNDGQRPVQQYNGNNQTGNMRETVCFPLSNSGLLINHIRGQPPLLQAWIIVNLSAALSLNSANAYSGSVYINIEYN